MTTTIELDEIPGPHGLPVVGNVFDIDAANPIEGFMAMARDYGPIFKLTLPGGFRLILSDPELVEEVCDDTRFDKLVSGGLANLREGAADSGLFTSETDDPLWRRAHNILMAPFSLQAMRDYMPKMVDIAEQLLDKWTRLNPGDEVDVPDDMTRLTLDTIALCGFGYRFNSFYRDTPHPFVQAMVRTLSESQARARQLPFQTRLRIRAQRQLEEDQAFMNDLVDRLVAERRAQGAEGDTTDLLGRMLTGVDKQSGEGLPDVNIRAQCITFLIAGHETTSGLLSFAIYYLLKNPAFMERARREVDEVLGDTAAPTFEQVHRLTYVRQVLDESLRLWPTAPGFTRRPREDTTIGGRYHLPADTAITVLTPILHRAASVWGPDAEEFNPDHMSPERVAALSPNAYKPFGSGLRACIGRQFALQEATLVLGMLLQRCDLVDHLDYQLRTKTTLTVKPADFRIQVRPRPGHHVDRAAPAEVRRDAGPTTTAATATAATPTLLVPRHGTRLSVLFGSNLGTAESIATRIAQEGTERGFDVTVGPLDDHVDDLPRDGALIVVTASYNGTPPDNAAEFCRWISGAKADAARGVSYAVFGCGNTEWASTYQAIPTLIDEELEKHGAERIHPRGAGNAAGDFDADYRAWHGDMWADIARALDLPDEVATAAARGPRLAITLTNRQVSNPVIVSYEAHAGLVRENRELIGSSDGEPPSRSVRHIEVALPTGLTYRAGDHLGVLPRNRIESIGRVMAHFGLDGGQYITIIPNSGSHTHLPIDEPTPLLGVLGTCVELQDVASRDDLAVLARYTEDPEEKAALESMAGDDEPAHAAYREKVYEPNRSVLDLLEEYPSCRLPFEVFLDLLHPLRPRYYSISSSPLASPDVASITTGVLEAPARSGAGTYEGVCSNHLAEAPPKGTVFVFVRPPSIPFAPPENPHVPMIMAGAGTGLAPFRGFLQERAKQKEQGVPIAPSVLFFGCRNPDTDLLYADELADYERQGVVRVERCYSDAPGQGRRYVQAGMLERADEVWDLLQRDAVVLVCGNAATIAPGVRASLTTIFRDRTGTGEKDAEAWLAGLQSAGRLVEDIWGG
ncbi:bifunctional cytochrome P450/NADPH--P450 reductase [Nocardioides iriomotensis]|uniref:Bifunctional cytochrome P450/NADPH--P450 reductase n=1 Tax=Nocardioides iriomotensis TaxID=715784 RepID=A0A4Q5J0G2_9ACTN|nr:cytochrome P450 [Nocardioides iriomotensis]RYU11814.1 cytochrome P450 [Nocardioides iriomotensis]